MNVFLSHTITITMTINMGYSHRDIVLQSKLSATYFLHQLSFSIVITRLEFLEFTNYEYLFTKKWTVHYIPKLTTKSK